jgi:hypothetical protein
MARAGGLGSVSETPDAPAGLEGFEFVIEADGSVTFIDFPPELLDVALALNPDDPLVCERAALLKEAVQGE